MAMKECSHRFKDAGGPEIVSFSAGFVLSGITLVSCLLQGGLYWSLFGFYLYFALLRMVSFFWNRSILKNRSPKSEARLAYFMNAALLASLIPSMAAGVFVLFFQNVPFYAYSSLAYGYAAFCFYRFYQAIAGYVKSRKRDDLYEGNLCRYSIVSGIFSMMALTILLSAGASKEQPYVLSQEIRIVCYCLEGALIVAILCLGILGLLRAKKKKHDPKTEKRMEPSKKE